MPRQKRTGILLIALLLGSALPALAGTKPQLPLEPTRVKRTCTDTGTTY